VGAGAGVWIDSDVGSLVGVVVGIATQPATSVTDTSSARTMTTTAANFDRFVFMDSPSCIAMLCLYFWLNGQRSVC
jgi:hypothetical protein